MATKGQVKKKQDDWANSRLWGTNVYDPKTRKWKWASSKMK